MPRKGKNPPGLPPDFLTRLVDCSDDAIIASTLEGTIASWNRGAEALFGYRAEEAIGKPLSILVPAEELSGFRQGQERLKRGENLPRFETLVVRKDGTKCEISIAVSSLPDAAGRVVATAAIIRDISERKRAEEALRQSEASFRFLFANSPLPMWVFSLETLRFLEVNDAPLALYGYSRQEFLQMCILDHLMEKEQQKLRAVLAKHQGGFRSAGEWWHRTKSGTAILVEIFVHSLDWEGQRAEHVVAVDITKRRQAEDALRLSEERWAREARESTKLTELVEVLQSCQTPEEACQVTVGTLAANLPSPSGALCLTSPSRNLVEAVVSWGDNPATQKTFLPVDCWALRRGKIHSGGHSAPFMRCAHVSGSPAGGYFCVPLAAQGEVLGVLYVELPALHSYPQSAEDSTEHFGRSLSAVAERFSFAMANLRLREVLRNQSIRDPLTGLFNRRYLEESLERELRRAARAQQKVALLAFDIDHFKRFNDTFGHPAGDTLLRSLGNMLNERTRGQDVACRVGGEEFILLLADTSLDGAAARANLLRQEVSGLMVQHAGQTLGRVTVSIGISGFPTHGTTSEELLQAADQALYRAKSQGRDRAVVA